MAINIKITSDETIEHGGKQYRTVAIRSPKQSEKYLSPTGNVCIAGHGFGESVYVILEEVKPPYRVPTDEDAKQRPMAEFWDDSAIGVKLSGSLIAVKREGARRRFVAMDPATYSVGAWEHCRIQNEQK